MTKSRLTPETMIAAATLLCLAIFLATLTLPRADGQLVGSDGIRYYSYVPSIVLDGDVDMTNEFDYFASAGIKTISSSATTENGVPPNQWPIGPAIFWIPFFLIAHMISFLVNGLGMEISTNGLSAFYQAFVLAGNILYGGLGLFFIYRLANRYVEQQIALLATLLLLLAGNIIYYMTAEPFMAHNLSLLFSAIFFYIWSKRQAQTDWRTHVLYGLLGGVMALIRPQDGLFLMLPFLAQLPDVWKDLRNREGGLSWLLWLRNGIISGFVSLLVFSIQLWVWAEIYGNAFTSPYTYQNQDVLFYWLRPKLGAVLFSAYRGLFVWHPIFLAALIGLGVFYHEKKRLATVYLFAFLLQFYIVSSWHSWYQGDSFGGRMFIVCTPIFAVGLASLIHWLTHHWSWKWLITVGLVLSAWNFLLFVEYRFFLATASRIPNWYDLTVGRIIFLLDFLT